MKNVFATLVSLIAVLVFAALTVVMDNSGHIVASIVMIVLGGASMIGFMKYMAEPEALTK